MRLETLLKYTNYHGPSELSRIDYLDGWRGVALLLVMLEHFFHVQVVEVGRLGVDIFFVLSGMLMSNILFVKKVPLKTFYKRRISRILPVFFLYVTSISIVSWIFNLSNEHNNYLYNLLFLRAYYPVTPDLWHTGLPVGHLWSLNVEEHSYVILSLVVLISTLFRRVYVPIILVGIGSILIKYIYIKFPDFAPSNYDLRTETLASFLMISAGYHLIKNRYEKYIPSWSPVVTLALAFLCYIPCEPFLTAKWMLAPFLLAFTVNHLSLIADTLKCLLAIFPLRMIGVWSFSIYLWQQPFYYYGVKFGHTFKFCGPILFLVSIVVGAISFYFFENPIRTYLNEKW